MRKLIPILVTLVSALLWAGTCGNGYSFSKQVTVNHSKVPNTDQTDFVSTLCFNGACRSSFALKALATVANGGQIQNVANNTFPTPVSGPADFILCDASSAGNAIPFVVPYYRADTGAIEIKYKQTLSHTVDTSMWMFWGNAGVVTSQQNVANTFSNSYLHVYTFGDGQTILADDLLNTDNMTQVPGAPAFATPGTSGGGAYAPGNMRNTSTAFTTATTNITYSLWMMTAGVSQLGSIWENGSGNNRYALSIGSTGCGNSNTLGLLFGGITCNALSASYTLTAGKWQHVTIRRGATTWKLLVDGVLQANTNSNPNSVSAASNILGGGSVANVVSIDDFTVSSVERTDDWDATEYNNQLDPKSFFTISGTDTTAHIVQWNYCSYSFVQNQACAFPGPVTSGNLIVVAEDNLLPSGSDDCTTETHSDTLGSTYSLVKSATQGPATNATACIFSAVAAGTGANTVTAGFSTTQVNGIWIGEFGNTLTTVAASAADSSNSGTSPLTLSSVNAPGNNAVMLCTAMESPANGGTYSSMTPSNFVFNKIAQGSNTQSGATGWAIVTSGSHNCTFVGSGFVRNAGATVVFNATPSVTKRRMSQIY